MISENHQGVTSQTFRLLGVVRSNHAPMDVIERLLAGEPSPELAEAVRRVPVSIPQVLWQGEDGRKYVMEPTRSGMEPRVYQMSAENSYRSLSQTTAPPSSPSKGTTNQTSEGAKTSDDPVDLALQQILKDVPPTLQATYSGVLNQLPESLRPLVEKQIAKLPKMAVKQLEKWAKSQAEKLNHSLYGDVEKPQKDKKSDPSVWENPIAWSVQKGVDEGIDAAMGLVEDGLGLSGLDDNSTSTKYLEKFVFDKYVSPYLKDYIQSQVLTFIQSQFPQTLKGLNPKEGEDPVKSFKELLGMDTGPKYLAAREGDPTTHGGFVASGAAHTLINGQLAVRAGDDHICLRCGPIDAVVIEGNPTILIEGAPAARLQHKTICGAEIAPLGGNVFYGPDPTNVSGGAPPSAPSSQKPAKPAAGAGGNAAGSNQSSGGAAGESGGASARDGSGAAGTDSDAPVVSLDDAAKRDRLDEIENRKQELRDQMISGGLTPEQEGNVVDEEARLEKEASGLRSDLGIDEDPDPHRTPYPPPSQPAAQPPLKPPANKPEPDADPKDTTPENTPPKEGSNTEIYTARGALGTTLTLTITHNPDGTTTTTTTQDYATVHDLKIGPFTIEGSIGSSHTVITNADGSPIKTEDKAIHSELSIDNGQNDNIKVGGTLGGAAANLGSAAIEGPKFSVSLSHTDPETGVTVSDKVSGSMGSVGTQGGSYYTEGPSVEGGATMKGSGPDAKETGVTYGDGKVNVEHEDTKITIDSKEESVTYQDENVSVEANKDGIKISPPKAETSED